MVMASDEGNSQGRHHLPTGEQIVYRQSNPLPGVEELVVRQSSRLWKVLHDSYSVSTSSGSATTVAYRGVQHAISGPGGLLVTEPGEIHENTWVAGPLDFCVLFISPPLMRRASIELGNGPTVHFRPGITDAPPVYSAFRKLHRSLVQAEDDLASQSHFATALRLLVSSFAERPPRDAAVCSRRDLERVREALHAHLTANVSLDDLARIGNLSKYHIVRAFDRQYGAPPHAYRMLLRAAAARDRLRAGVPPAETALETGFSDQSHLTRVFRRVYGVPPGRYSPDPIHSG